MRNKCAREKHCCDARGHRARISVQVYGWARVSDTPADALHKVLRQHLFPPSQGEAQLLVHFTGVRPEGTSASDRMRAAHVQGRKRHT